MKPKSAKAKGQRAATELKGILLKAFPHLEAGDIRVTPSGVNGEDLQLSPRARRLLDFHFEVKNVEKLNIWQALCQSKKHGTSKPLLVFKRNRTPFHVAMDLDTFLDLFK